MKKIIISTLLVLTIFTNSFANVCGTRYTEIVPIVTAMGFKITSTTGGRHNKNSKHKLGMAVDVSVRGKSDFHINTFIAVLTNRGYVVLDERVRPIGQKVWGGPHLHVHAPFCDAPIRK